MLHVYLDLSRPVKNKKLIINYFNPNASSSTHQDPDRNNCSHVKQQAHTKNSLCAGDANLLWFLESQRLDPAAASRMLKVSHPNDKIKIIDNIWCEEGMTDYLQSRVQNLWHVNCNFIREKLSQSFVWLWDFLPPLMQSSKTILK